MVRLILVLVSIVLLIDIRMILSASLENESVVNEERSFKLLGDLKYVFHTYQECSASDLPTCLKLKLLKTVDRIARSDKEFTITEGVSFIKDPSKKDEKEKSSIEEATEDLPRSLGERNEALDNLLFNKVLSFFKGHILQVII